MIFLCMCFFWIRCKVCAQVAVLVLAALGKFSLWAAVAVDAGTALIVVANGMTLLRWRGAADACAVDSGCMSKSGCCAESGLSAIPGCAAKCRSGVAGGGESGTVGEGCGSHDHSHGRADGACGGHSHTRGNDHGRAHEGKGHSHAHGEPSGCGGEGSGGAQGHACARSHSAHGGCGARKRCCDGGCGPSAQYVGGHGHSHARPAGEQVPAGAGTPPRCGSSPALLGSPAKLPAAGSAAGSLASLSGVCCEMLACQKPGPLCMSPGKHCML